ncbi:MAG: type II toxin-antitoxin system VapC family toxin [Solirubrobacterales bacterium]|nr:type II toxin-antitoxin system VapC family toxin [Solirubrobacterales bacterium]
MLILDTTVASELIRPGRDAGVDRWMRKQAPAARCITVITVAEVEYGVRRMPDGQRKDALADGVARLFAAFTGQILDFDRESAGAYARVRVERESRGRPISVLDAQIGAICRVHGATLATRNVKDFDGLDLSLVNPWEA